MLIAGGVVVGAAVLVVLMRSHNSASSGGNISGGVTDIMGGFQTAGTIYVPTSSYDIQYNNYKDSSVTYSTVTNNNNSQTTTTYQNSDNINSPSGGGSVTGSPVIPAPAPIPAPPIISGGNTPPVNPPTQQTGTTPAAPAPVAPPPPPAWRAMGTMHYATPAGGWNPNSVVDYVKDHGGYSDFASRAIYAQNNGIANYTGTEAQNIQMLNKMKSQFGGF
jgi:hypothetical protein